MPEQLPNYDQWKLASPDEAEPAPEDDERETLAEMRERWAEDEPHGNES